MNWYSPGSIRYRRSQCTWLLAHWYELRCGDWPADPNGSSYVDVPGKPQVRPGAYFERAATIMGELERRIQRTGQDGVALRLFYCMQDSVPMIARAMGWSPRMVNGKIDRALRYICGGRAKTYSYRDFIDHKRPAQVS